MPRGGEIRDQFLEDILKLLFETFQFASTYLEEVSIKTSKYLCSSKASWILLGFPEFEGAFNLDSLLGKGSLF